MGKRNATAPAFERLEVNRAADDRFLALARELGVDPDNQWVGGYVDYEWNYGRHIYQSVDSVIGGKLWLEFGCNYGATSIVLAALGANVVGIDVSERVLRLAEANALRYEVLDRIALVLGSSRTALPFREASFDCVVCNSVLEYVAEDRLAFFQKELDRVLKPGGLIFVSGTSNRLAPREVHSGRWFSNYRFSRLDSHQQGVAPWKIRYGFGDYDNLDWLDRGRAYLRARELMPGGSRRRWLRCIANLAARRLGVSLGLLTPSLAVVLRKKRHSSTEGSGLSLDRH